MDMETYQTYQVYKAQVDILNLSRKPTVKVLQKEIQIREISKEKATYELRLKMDNKLVKWISNRIERAWEVQINDLKALYIVRVRNEMQLHYLYWGINSKNEKLIVWPEKILNTVHIGDDTYYLYGPYLDHESTPMLTIIHIRPGHFRSHDILVHIFSPLDLLQLP